jgi:hypothetical protein
MSISESEKGIFYRGNNMSVTPDFKDQVGVPLQILDIFIYAQNRGLILGKGVVLGFASKGGWIKYGDLSDLERTHTIMRRRPNDIYSWENRADNIWLINELLNRKRPDNLIKIGRWQPTRESVEQIQCPELVDLILNNL